MPCLKYKALPLFSFSCNCSSITWSLARTSSASFLQSSCCVLNKVSLLNRAQTDLASSSSFSFIHSFLYNIKIKHRSSLYHQNYNALHTQINANFLAKKSTVKQVQKQQSEIHSTWYNILTSNIYYNSDQQIACLKAIEGLHPPHLATRSNSTALLAFLCYLSKLSPLLSKWSHIPSMTMLCYEF